jgi:hypothetical protein
VKELLGKPKPAAAVASTAEAPESTSTPVGAPSSVPENVVPANGNGAGMDDYFDRLDAAFAGLGNASEDKGKTTAAAPSLSDQLDWFTPTPEKSAAPNSEPVDLPKPADDFAEFHAAASSMSVSYASPKAAFDAAADNAKGNGNDRHAAAVSVALAPAPTHAPASVQTPATAPRQGGSLPPLADAFAALLAAEHSESKPNAAPLWPVSGMPTSPVSPPPPAPAAPAIVPDDLIDRVVREVLDRLSDTVVRDAVSDVVSQIAERLVREEIDRIKASIK